MPRYANVDKLMEHAIRMDWSVLKWVNEVDICTAINPNVVKVVRCKDCIHGIPSSYDLRAMKASDVSYCNRYHMCHFEDYYCADGKRKGREDEYT